ncbi:iron complex transport system permease protein [Maribacter caenipelagi]|uniref:Iron complex transport system permease protein n=1 Tax=Maribacter caenipelagi TaxID=1447781 RepID=A0A4R7D3I2_9FLAO|nr:iron ABC transporter permease [Maribacter caenipelagi]TDS15370.1 iron complex transport system permease protein [Maribacter caenipelagi]
MTNQSTYSFHFIGLLIVLLICFVINICLGSVTISFIDTLKILFGSVSENDSNTYIIWQYRLPKAITAILVGGGLSLSGLLMQTLFRNPLAGPYVLGISSGASLGAALLIMGTSLFSGALTFSAFNDITLAIASSLGSFFVLSLVLVVAAKVKDTMALLIIGLMFGSITAAIVSVLSYFTKAEKLQRYIFWSFGSLGNLSWVQLLIVALCTMIGIFLSIISIKPLNAFLLGENYAKSLGIGLQKSRYIIIVATGLLAGSITAFAGPIAFVGLAVPHITKQLIHTTDHKIQIPAVLCCGATLMLICDTIAQLPGSVSVLPINAITSILGAPVVIWLLVRKRKMIF